MFPDFKTFGPLRALLLALVLALVALRPFADGPITYSGWMVVPTLVVPAVAPIVFFVLLLELMMVRIFYSAAQDETRAGYGRVLRLELIVLVIFVLAWASYYGALLST